MQSRQLGHGGFLREAEERVLPPSGPVGRLCAGVLQDARCVSQVLQRGETEGKAGMDEPDAVSKEFGAGSIAGPKKCPHPPICVPVGGHFASDRRRYGNYLSYVGRAQKAFPDDPIDAHVAKVYRKINKATRRVKKGKQGTGVDAAI